MEAFVQESSRVPEKYLHRSGTAKDIPFHEHAFVSAETVKVDIDRNLWINPGALYAKDAAKISAPQVGIVREEAGFKVILDSHVLGRHVWEVDAEFNPAISHNLRWLRVVAIEEI
jgi:hypothetical protein